MVRDGSSRSRACGSTASAVIAPAAKPAQASNVSLIAAKVIGSRGLQGAIRR
jgi:hypothetical protein